MGTKFYIRGGVMDKANETSGVVVDRIIEFLDKNDKEGAKEYLAAFLPAYKNTITGMSHCWDDMKKQAEDDIATLVKLASGTISFFQNGCSMADREEPCGLTCVTIEKATNGFILHEKCSQHKYICADKVAVWERIKALLL